MDAYRSSRTVSAARETIRKPTLVLAVAVSVLFVSCERHPDATPPTPATSRAGRGTGATLGVYYFGGWSEDLSNFHFRGLPDGPFAGREPLYGWIDDSTSTMRTQLYWAHRIGIEFFNFLWYSRPARFDDPGLNTALGNYVAIRDRQGVRFAITYVNHPPFEIPARSWHRVAERWVTEYFTDPDYVRIDGRPVFFLYGSTEFFERYRTDARVNAALAELRRAARAHGLPGVFVVAGLDTGDFWNYPPGEPTAGERYDAATQYAYWVEPVAGEHSYAELAAVAREQWRDTSTTAAHPYIPVVLAGWDPRPWDEHAPGVGVVWHRRTPADVAGLLSEAIGWSTSHPSERIDGADGPLVLLTAWNELGEGMYIEPTIGDGFGYARAIASVLGNEWDPRPRVLTVAVRGPGRVLVGDDTCARRCSRGFAEGLVVTLRARPDPGSLFAGWGGGCTGTASVCSQLMGTPRSVTATFASRSPSSRRGESNP